MNDPREETPWNYCDYRCERCRYQSTCKVYHQVEVERQIQIMEGKDPDDMSVALESVANTFKEVIEDLQEAARKWGIDLDAVTEEANREHRSSFDVTKEDPLYQTSYQLTLDLMKFIRQWRQSDAESSASDEAWGDLIWHHTLFSAKLARALSGFRRGVEWDPEWGTPDYQVSAGIAVESLKKCKRALEALRPSLPGAASEVDNFLLRLAELSESVQDRLDQPM